jgi:predicted Na+-dependent transporter
MSNDNLFHDLSTPNPSQGEESFSNPTLSTNLPQVSSPTFLTMGGLAAEVGAHVLLFLLVFGMSATVDIGHMRKQLRNKYALLTGIALQFFILPFVGFLIVKILKMDAPMGITLLVVTSSPGGSYSNCK